MFLTIIVMCKGITSIVRRIYIDTFDLIFKCICQSTKCEQIVAVDEHITRPRFFIRESACFDFSEAILGSVNEQTWLNGKLFIILAYPRQFQFIYLVLCHKIFCL